MTGIINEYTGKEYLKATGNLKFGLTNDYLFRIVFQKNKYALKGLLSSVLHLQDDEIIDINIKNTIIPGKSITDKEYRMDIVAILNNNTSIDLEMQLCNWDDWPERSLSYLCREFDDLHRGKQYSEVLPTYQIGLIDFTLFPDHPEFNALYQMRNAKDGHLYTGKFNLIVISFNQTDLATAEDISSGLTEWVKLFKAKTWEETRMIASDNDYMASAAETMYLSSEDYNIIKVAREREDFLAWKASNKKEKTMLSRENAALKAENDSLAAANNSLAAENDSLAAANNSLAAENNRLIALLKEHGIEA